MSVPIFYEAPFIVRFPIPIFYVCLLSKVCLGPVHGEGYPWALSISTLEEEEALHHGHLEVMCQFTASLPLAVLPSLPPTSTTFLIPH